MLHPAISANSLQLTSYCCPHKTPRVVSPPGLANFWNGHNRSVHQVACALQTMHAAGRKQL